MGFCDWKPYCVLFEYLFELVLDKISNHICVIVSQNHVEKETKNCYFSCAMIDSPFLFFLSSHVYLLTLLIFPDAKLCNFYMHCLYLVCMGWICKKGLYLVCILQGGKEELQAQGNVSKNRMFQTKIQEKLHYEPKEKNIIL